MILLKWILFSSAIFCYGSFLWSATSLFTEKEDQHSIFYLTLKVISLSFWIYSLFLSATGLETALYTTCGILLNAGAFTLFIFSARAIRNRGFSSIYGKDIPGKIFTEGPYNYTRNPFYASYLMCYWGMAFALRSAVLAGLAFLLLLFYLFAIRLEENKFIYSDSLLEFMEYKSKTGRIFPKIFGRKASKK